MDLKQFKKAHELLHAIEYATNTLAKLEEYGSTKYIKIGPVQFSNISKGSIETDGLKADTTISGYNSVYYDSLSAFNDKVVSDFKVELKAQIIKLQEQFKNL